MPKIVRRFDSLTELVDAASKSKGGSSTRESYRERGGRRGGLNLPWHGTDTRPEAFDLAREGWHEIRPQVETMLGDLKGNLANIVKPTMVGVFSDAGSQVDIGRYMMNEPESMVQFTIMEQERPEQVVTILIAGTCSAAVNTQAIVNRGAALVALLDLIDASGFTTELFMENTVHGLSASNSHTVLTRIKDAGTPFDIDAIMYAISHPSYLRRLVFAMQETEPMDIRQTFGFTDGGGYGRPPYHCIMGKEVNADIVLGEPSNNEHRDIGWSVNWILNTMDKLGIKLERTG